MSEIDLAAGRVDQMLAVLYGFEEATIKRRGVMGRDRRRRIPGRTSEAVNPVLFKYASARWPSRASYPRPSHAFRDKAV